MILKQQTSQGYPQQRAGEDTREYNPTDCHRTHDSYSSNDEIGRFVTVPI